MRIYLTRKKNGSSAIMCVDAEKLQFQHMNNLVAGDFHLFNFYGNFFWSFRRLVNDSEE